MRPAPGISVTHETIRQWGLKFGREFANRILRLQAPHRGAQTRHLDEASSASFAGNKHWLSAWCPSTGRLRSSDILVSEPVGRQEGKARQALVPDKLRTKAGSTPRVLHHRQAKELRLRRGRRREIMPGVEHRSIIGLITGRKLPSPDPTRERHHEAFKSAAAVSTLLLAAHDQVAKQFPRRRTTTRRVTCRSWPHPAFATMGLRTNRRPAIACIIARIAEHRSAHRAFPSICCTWQVDVPSAGNPDPPLLVHPSGCCIAGLAAYQCGCFPPH